MFGILLILILNDLSEPVVLSDQGKLHRKIKENISKRLDENRRQTLPRQTEGITHPYGSTPYVDYLARRIS